VDGGVDDSRNPSRTTRGGPDDYNTYVEESLDDTARGGGKNGLNGRRAEPAGCRSPGEAMARGGMDWSGGEVEKGSKRRA